MASMIHDPLIGYQLSNFRIERLIGQGGMAQVYYGWDQALHSPVAIKVIDARHRGNIAHAQRFVQEARTVSTWRHDNILQVYYAGEENGLYYFAMEYIDGLDLGQLIARYGQEGELMPHADVLRIAGAVATALDYAHAKGVIHRDIKPSNVMIARDERVVLADFGLAMDIHQGSLGQTFGTPHYIPPEQARNSSLAVPQSDLYSLGVILYEMLTGIVPFDDPSPTSLAVQHLTLPPPPPRLVNPALNEATEAVLLKVLQKEPEQRYESGELLVDTLAAALAGKAAAAPIEAKSNQPPPLPPGFSPPPRRIVSQVSVAERVSLQEPPPLPPLTAPVLPVAGTKSAASPPLPPAPPLRRTPAQPGPVPMPVTGPKRPGNTFIGVGLFVLLVILWLAARAFLPGDTTEGTAGNPAAVTEAATEVAVIIEATALLSTEVPQATETATDDSVVAAATPLSPTAVLPTAVLPTGTASPTNAPTVVPATESPAVAPVQPTIAYPNGRRTELLYDNSSFYFYNATDDRIDMRPLDFEAIDENGNALRYFFSSSQWTQFFTYVEEGHCDRIEINRTGPWLRPPQCQAYNSTVTPSADSDFIFWVQQPGAARFRVLWNGEEIARCEFGVERCEVYLP